MPFSTGAAVLRGRRQRRVRRRSRRPRDARSRGGAASASAAATTVAMRPRSATTSPLPSGCTRFARKHDERARDGIDPERRPGPPGMPERADREECPAVDCEPRVDVPAEPAHLAERRRRRRPRHQRHRQRRQQAHAVERPAVQQHAAEARQVCSGAEQACMAGNAAHAPCRRVVHDAAQHRRVRSAARPASGGRVRSARSSGRSAAGGRNVVSRIPSGSKMCVARKRVEALPAHARDDLAEQEEVDVAVDEPLALARQRALPRWRAGSRPPAPGTPVPGRGRRAGPRRGVSRWRMVMRCLPYRPNSGM